MVLEPKTNHGDYGSFQSTQAGHHNLHHHHPEDEDEDIDTRHLHNHAPHHRLLHNQEVVGVGSSSSGGGGGGGGGEATPSEEIEVEGKSAPVTVMTQDVYQRQPLLPQKGMEDGSWDLSGGLGADDYLQRHNHESRNGVVKIDLPPPLRDEPRFPKEKGKTLLAFLFLCLNWILTTASLAVVHEKVPDRDSYGPLPDVVLDNIQAADWALDVSEILIIVAGNTCVVVLLLHKHRFIILRRVFLLLGLLYLMRSVTMFVTVLPVASRTYYCSPKANSTNPLLIAKRIVKLLSGLGLSINGQHTYCGDYMYSGHTVILVTAYLVIQEYTPRRLFLLHWLAWLSSITGIVMVLVSHGHYTIDVVVAYYITTRLFWMYHTLANNTMLKQKGPSNFLARVWWFSIFRYFEKNVSGVVPRQYECPLPPCWSRRIFAKPPNRDS